jgi:hypothetical protein
MNWTQGPRPMWGAPLTAVRQALVLSLQMTAGVCDILTDWLQPVETEADPAPWYDHLEEALPGW